MMFLFWVLFGALVGGYAAQSKGLSTVGGTLGGALLGPLAFLVFFVSGIGSANEQQKKCPFCAEWVRREAYICKHCRGELGSAVVVRENVADVSRILQALGANSK